MSAMRMPSQPRIFNAPLLMLPSLRKPPVRPHAPFFKLPSHTLPTKWSLYRTLLRLAPDMLHLEAVKRRWRRPRNRYCTSPRLTMRLLRGEEQLSKDYLELSKLISRSPEVPSTISSISPNSAGEMSVTQTTGGSDSPLYLPSPDTEAPNVRVPIPYHLSHGLNKETADRLQVLAGHLEKFLLDRHTSNSLIEEYHASLEQARSYYRPIRTPGLIFPSLLNIGLPRIKPQPLHMTMVMTRRQKARDRRIMQLRSWQEMELHQQLEQRLDRSVATLGTPPADGPLEIRNDYVKAAAAVLQRSELANLRRINFSSEILAKRDEARRFRPSVLTMQRRKKDTTARLKRLSQASKRKD